MKPHISIALIFAFFAICGCVAGACYNYEIMKGLLEEQAILHLETTARARALNIESFIAEEEAILRIISLDKNITLQDLSRAMAVNPGFYSLFILDSNGTLVASSGSGENSTDFSRDDIFLMGNKGTYFQNIRYDDNIRGNSMALAVPYSNGVLAARLLLDEINAIAADTTGLMETGESYAVNENKKLLTPSRTGQSILIQDVNTENAEDCIAAMENYYKASMAPKENPNIFLNYQGEKVFGTYAYISKLKWCVLAEISLADVHKPTNLFVCVSIAIMLLILLLITLVGFHIGRMIERNKRLNVTRRLIFAVLLVLLAITLASCICHGLAANSILQSQAYHQLETAAQSKASHVDNFLKSHREAVELAAGFPELDTQLLEEVREIGGFYSLFIANRSGKVTASSDVARLGQDISLDEYFMHARSQTYIKQHYHLRGIELIAISTPYSGGVLVGEINAEELGSITGDRAGFGETGQTLIVDNNAGYTGVQPTLANSLTGDSVFYPGTGYMIAEYPVRTAPWQIMASIAKVELTERVGKAYLALLMMGVVATCFITIVVGIPLGKRLEENSHGTNNKEGRLTKRLAGLSLLHYAALAIAFDAILFAAFMLINPAGRSLSLWLLPELIAVALTIMFMGYGFRIRLPISRFFVVFGCAIVALGRLAQIFLIEFYYGNSRGLLYHWIPGLAISIMGIFIIFMGFKRLKK
jgi:hypothetical protein